ncbi:MFS transporter [Marinomonas aquimarina]|nr:MFS transporter [Marinomonas aquimarina]
MTRETTDDTANWSGVFAMTLCAFLMVAAEFMPVSLLTPMAQELSVTEGAVGQGIAISGIFALIVALSVSSVAGNADRKKVLMALTGVMLVSGLLVAFAANYAMYMAGRALVGVALGGFWSMSAAAAMRLVPAHKVPKALAIFNGGNALAMVVAAPLGSLLGALVSWRGAFFFLVPVALVAFVWQYMSLPSMAAEGEKRKLHHIFRPLKRQEVAVGFFATALLFMGQFTLYTYIRPFLEMETQVSESMLTLVLLMIGVAGFIGTSLISRFLGKSLFYTLMTMPVLLALCAFLLIEFGAHDWVVMPVLFVWGLIATSAPVGWWTWVAQTMPDDAEAGGGLMVAIVQLAIGLGSTVGGILFDMWGYQSAFSVSGILLLLSGVMAFMAMTVNKRWSVQEAS